MGQKTLFFTLSSWKHRRSTVAAAGVPRHAWFPHKGTASYLLRVSLRTVYLVAQNALYKILREVLMDFTASYGDQKYTAK
jgi:hypothetical protein